MDPNNTQHHKQTKTSILTSRWDVLFREFTIMTVKYVFASFLKGTALYAVWNGLLIINFPSIPHLYFMMSVSVFFLFYFIKMTYTSYPYRKIIMEDLFSIRQLLTNIYLIQLSKENLNDTDKRDVSNGPE